MESKSNKKIWKHWGYSVIPLIYIALAIAWLVAGRYPDQLIDMGYQKDYAYLISKYPEQGYLMLLVGASFWPIRYVMNKARINQEINPD